jgi:prophage tail gpP-like protein
MASLADTGEILIQSVSEFFSNLKSDSDDVALEINGQVFSGWKSLSLTQKIDDMVSTLGIDAPFNPDNEDLRVTLEPFTYPEISVYLGKDQVAKVIGEDFSFGMDAGSRMCKIEARSPAGILCDVQIEGNEAQYNGLTLKQFFETVLQPFGDLVIVDFKADSNPTLGDVRPEIGKSYFDFLKQVYEPKGLIVTDDNFGRLVVDEKPTGEGAPVFSFIEGETKMDNLSASYKGSERFSFYIVYGNSGGANFKSEASDPVINASVFRPFVKVQSDSESQDKQTAAPWERALAIARSIQVSFSVPGWRREDGQLWKKGDIVTVKAPSIYLYNETKMIVSGISYTLSESDKDVALSLILPQTYTSELPEVYPWD